MLERGWRDVHGRWRCSSNCSPMPATIATSRRASIASPARRPEADISFFTRLLFAAYFLEAGLILIVAPWSGFWDRNLFLGADPVARQRSSTSPFARGAVSGVGVITVLAGLAELTGVLAHRQPPPGLAAGGVVVAAASVRT